MSWSLYRYTAFSTDPRGGNPAGVWIGERLPSPGEMQRIAAEVGFSETAFTIRQGEAMGRPSRLIVDIPESGGIVVSGSAVRLSPESEETDGS